LSGESKRYKALNFDLDTNRLIAATGNPYTGNAYKKIRTFFESNGFEHRQYSGYRSSAAYSDSDVLRIVNELYEAYPWLNDCVQRFDVTNIGRTFDIHESIQKAREMQSAYDDDFDIADSYRATPAELTPAPRGEGHGRDGKTGQGRKRGKEEGMDR
jgi:virulence-associated protein VapD